MAKKLKVDELRTELAKRGLNTTGTKATLNQRLESALCKENKSSTDASSASAGKKRHREAENGNSNGLEKIKAIENLREMGIRQSREQAILKDISASGSKKELLERLCIDSEKDSNDVSKGNEEDDKEGARKKEKQVTATKEGSAVLDQYLPDHIKTEYHVLQHGDEIYDAMLNQTNVGENNNKFYVIQALEANDGGKFMVYTRWGRVGIKGQDKIQGPYTLRDDAIREFALKFFAKTKNHWCDRKNFICYPKYYTWLEMDYSADKESEVQEKPISTMENQLQITKLEPRIANFISLICNIGMMKQQMMGLGYNAEKMPLGKLSKSSILKGFDVLKRIADVIGQSDRKKLEQLSGEFYTVIPHDFGFKKIHEFIIDTHYRLKCKLEMVEALGEIEFAASMLKHDIYTKEDPLYSHYQCLRCELTPVEVDSEEFSMIARYMHNTNTNGYYKIDIAHIFRTSREGENERFKKFSRTKNRMLLWHGSRLTNWTGILSQGLRIAPPEAPVQGYAFGKGVYFADMFAKSVTFSWADCAAMDGVLVLCEVALGDMNELLAVNCNADKLPEGKLSTKGVGRITPDLSKAQVLKDGGVVPLGNPIEQPGPKGICGPNEYMVYNVDQIRMRCIVHVNFSYT